MRRKLSKCSECQNYFWEFGQFVGICSSCIETIEEPLGKKLQHSKPKRKQKSKELLQEVVESNRYPWNGWN